MCDRWRWSSREYCEMKTRRSPKQSTHDTTQWVLHESQTNSSGESSWLASTAMPSEDCTLDDDSYNSRWNQNLISAIAPPHRNSGGTIFFYITPDINARRRNKIRKSKFCAFNFKSRLMSSDLTRLELCPFPRMPRCLSGCLPVWMSASLYACVYVRLFLSVHLPVPVDDPAVLQPINMSGSFIMAAGYI